MISTCFILPSVIIIIAQIMEIDCSGVTDLILSKTAEGTASTTTTINPILKDHGLIQTLRDNKKFKERRRNRHRNIEREEVEIILVDYYDPFLSDESVRQLTTTTIRTTTTTPRPSEVLMVEMKDIHRHPGFADLFHNSESKSEEGDIEFERTSEPTVKALPIETATLAVTEKSEPPTKDAIESDVTSATTMTVEKSETTSATTLTVEKSETTSATMTLEKSGTTSATTMAVEKSETTSATTIIAMDESETTSATTMTVKESETTSATTMTVKESETTSATTMGAEKSDETSPTTVATEKSEAISAKTFAKEIPETTRTTTKFVEQSDTTSASVLVLGRMVMGWNKTAFTTEVPITNPLVDGKMAVAIPTNISETTTARAGAKELGRMVMSWNKMAVTTKVPITNPLATKVIAVFPDPTNIPETTTTARAKELGRMVMSWNKTAFTPKVPITNPQVDGKMAVPVPTKIPETTAVPSTKSSIAGRVAAAKPAAPSKKPTTTGNMARVIIPVSKTKPKSVTPKLTTAHLRKALQLPPALRWLTEASKFLYPNEKKTTRRSYSWTPATTPEVPMNEQVSKSTIPAATPATYTKGLNSQFQGRGIVSIQSPKFSSPVAAGQGINIKNSASVEVDAIDDNNSEDDFMELLSGENKLNEELWKLNSSILPTSREFEQSDYLRAEVSLHGRKVFSNPKTLIQFTTELSSRLPTQEFESNVETLNESGGFIDLVDSDEMQ